MATDVRTHIPWHHFLSLKEGAEGQLLAGRVEAWRQEKWPVLMGALKAHLPEWDPEEEEPHWVDEGLAIMWTEKRYLGRLGHSAESYDDQNRLSRVSSAWQPTSAMPFSSLGAVLHYLEESYRFRPPEGVHVELETAPPAASTKEEPRRVYICLGKHHRNPPRFTNWRTYIKCCINCRVMPQEEPPDEVLDIAAKSEYWCPTCWTGFSSRKIAERHLAYTRGVLHPYTLEQMRMKSKLTGLPKPEAPEAKEKESPRNCPQCGGRKSRAAKLCRDCFQANQAQTKGVANGKG